MARSILNLNIWHQLINISASFTGTEKKTAETEICVTEYKLPVYYSLIKSVALVGIV